MGKEGVAPSKETAEEAAFWREANQKDLRDATFLPTSEAKRSLKEGGASRASYISFLMEQGEYAGTPISFSQAAEEFDRNIYPLLSGQIGKMEEEISLVKNGEGAYYTSNQGETEKAPAYYSGGKIKIEKGQSVSRMQRGLRHEYGHGRDPEIIAEEIGPGGARPIIEIPEGADYTKKDYQEMFSKAGWTNLHNLHTTFPNLARRPSRMHMNSTEIVATIIGLRSWLGSARKSQPYFTPEDVKSIRETGTMPMPGGSKNLWGNELEHLLEQNPEATDREAADSFNKIIGFKDGPRTTEQKV